MILQRMKMPENIDDRISAAITAVSSVDSGSGGNDAPHVTAINSIITALEKAGILGPN